MENEQDSRAVSSKAVTVPAAPPPQEEDEPELRMSFTEHLAELRIRIIRSFIALGVAFFVCYLLSNQIFLLLARPLSSTGIADVLPGNVVTETASPADTPPTPAPPDGTASPPSADVPAAPPPAGTEFGGFANIVESDSAEKVDWVVLNPLEPVIVQVKLAMYTGVLVALPFILWQICAFIFPGLHRGERRIVQVLIFGCSLLGIAGMLVAYFAVFPLVLPYLLLWVPEGVTVQLRMNETMTIILYGLLGFALAFQFPMAVLILVYMDLLSPASLKQYRKLAIIGIAFVSAVLTPPDPISMTIMMVPLLVLYEVSIWASYLVVRRRRSVVPA